MMYATRSRRARPEPFAVRPGIAERLGLPYMDGALAFAAARARRRLSVFALEPGDAHDVPGDPGYYVDRQTIYAVLGIVGMYLLARDRLLALPRAAGRHLHLPLRKHLAGLRLRLRGARLAARLRPSLLQLPAIGARQAPARACACRVRHRWRQARLAEAAHGALPLPRPGPGCARLPAAGPRHRTGVRGDHPRRDVRGGRPLDALRGDRRGPRRSRRGRPRGRSRSSGRRSSRATRRRGSRRSCTPARTPATRATSRTRPRSPSAPERRPAVAIGPPRRGSTSFRSGTPTSSSR